MKRILLTGGNGFIGRNIKEQLSENYEVFAPTSKELDLLNVQAVGEYLRKNNITDVIHSAIYNQKRRNINSEIDLSANLKMFYNLIEYTQYLDKMIYFGSGAEYDKRFSIHMAKEETFGKRIPLMNDYGLSKYLMNLEARNSKNVYNLRLFGVYGQYEDIKTYFISHLCQCALQGVPLTIRQECIFDFLYVDDLIMPIQWFLENTPKFHDYNICSAKPIKLSEIAYIANNIFGKELSIKFLKDGMNLEYTGDNQRFNNEIKEEWLLTSIEEGIERVYYYIKNITS